ncbi:MAG: low molecular weight protein arginine phosphatase [Oscillospiraceae bacterium]|jgi:protein-tyrosine-phosphatase
MKTILFVCTGNTCRSAMAEGICNAMAKEQGWNLRAISCGLAAFSGDPPTEQAAEAARRYGADLKGHRARPLTARLVDGADVVYCMTRQQKRTLLGAVPEADGKVFCLAEEDISDPFGGSRAVYEQTAEEIARSLVRLLRQEGMGK